MTAKHGGRKRYGRDSKEEQEIENKRAMIDSLYRMKHGMVIQPANSLTETVAVFRQLTYMTRNKCDANQDGLTSDPLPISVEPPHNPEEE